MCPKNITPVPLTQRSMNMTSHAHVCFKHKRLGDKLLTCLLAAATDVANAMLAMTLASTTHRTRHVRTYAHDTTNSNTPRHVSIRKETRTQTTITKATKQTNKPGRSCKTCRRQAPARRTSFAVAATGLTQVACRTRPDVCYANKTHKSMTKTRWHLHIKKLTRRQNGM